MGSRWAVVCVLAGCYQPTFPAGAACASDADCPAGQPCVELVCGGTASLIDASESDAPADAPVVPPDGDPPPITILLGDATGELVDTELFEGEPALGDFDHISVDDVETSLIRFDLSNIAASSTVISAKLILRTFDEAATDGGTVTVHRMRESWSEDTATWDQRAINQPWMTIGAQPPSRDATPLAELVPLSINTDYEVDLPNATVQEWITTPAVNFGVAVVLGTTIEHIHFRSRENPPNSRLMLTIQP